MAGCFGDHWVDRELERQLMNHLNESSFDEFVENVDSEFDPDLYDKGLGKFFDNDAKVQEYLEHAFNEGIDPKTAANAITELYKIMTGCAELNEK